MASLINLLRGSRGAARPAGDADEAPAWARALFRVPLVPHLRAEAGEVLVWTVRDDASTATVTDQFKSGAEEYHRRYAASHHFEKLFRQAIDETGVNLGAQPLILDLGSGSGVNSIVPCRRLFPGARMIATDLSGELLAMLAHYLAGEGEGEGEGEAGDVVCVKMDAMSEQVAEGGFDLVAGASILHHLESPEQGLRAAGRALRPGGHAIFFEPFNGWAIMRLMFERILSEAGLRRVPLDPAADAVLRSTIADIAARSDPDTAAPSFRALDDKWLFSRRRVAASAKAAGFSGVEFVAHKGHQTLYRDMTAVQLRLSTGRDDLALPDWADAVVDSFDAALTADAKRELMMEGTIVLTKARVRRGPT